MGLYIGVILGAIIAFVVYRILGKKVTKPKKSVRVKPKGIDKFSVLLIAIAVAIVVFLAVVFVGLLITYS